MAQALDQDTLGRLSHRLAVVWFCQWMPISTSCVALLRIMLCWELLFKYHGRPSGIFAADEYLAGLEAVRE